MKPEGADTLLEDEAAAEVVEGPALSLFGSISILTVITLLVAAASECAAAASQQLVWYCGRVYAGTAAVTQDASN